MDAAKFGAFIAETRRQHGMTQARPPFPGGRAFYTIRYTPASIRPSLTKAL